MRPKYSESIEMANLYAGLKGALVSKARRLRVSLNARKSVGKGGQKKQLGPSADDPGHD
jgi:hypothetical protein